LRAELIQAVMCRNRIDFAAVEQRFGIRLEQHLARELVALRALERDGLVALDAHGVTVTPRGRLLLRVVAMVFDQSFQRPAPQVRAFSRVI
jgi:oxygen-independent coproporphyrinogen-3 oxidase